MTHSNFAATRSARQRAIPFSRDPRDASDPTAPTETPKHTPNAQLNDRRLRGRSRFLGLQSRGVRRRFLATLPELDRRGLVSKTYGSIFTYAAMVGGAQRREVLGALRLARRLERFPEVWQLFETGEVGRAVLMRVPVALLEEDEASWVRHFKTLSKLQIEALVAEERARRRESSDEAGSAGTEPAADRRRVRGAESRIRSLSASSAGRSLPGQVGGAGAGGASGQVGGAGSAAAPGQVGAAGVLGAPGQVGGARPGGLPGRMTLHSSGSLPLYAGSHQAIRAHVWPAGLRRPVRK